MAFRELEDSIRNILKRLGVLENSVVEVPETPDASTTVKGIVELATDAETEAGVDTERAVTPAGLKATLPAVLPDPETSTGNSTNSLASSWADIASVSDIVYTTTEDMWVLVTYGAWMNGSGDARATVAVSGATTVAETDPAWGMVLWASGTYQQRSGQKVIKLNAGTNTFKFRGYRASGSGSANYPTMTVIPLRWG